MAAAPVLADPSFMSEQERTDELCESIERDDLLAVLLVLSYCARDEVNQPASASRTTPLEAALISPTNRTPVRRLIAECLLQRGARADDVLQRPLPVSALPVVEAVLRGWNAGGREQATTSYKLCFSMLLHEAEPFIAAHGLGTDGPVDPAPLAAASESLPPTPSTSRLSPVPSASASGAYKGPAPHEASSSARRGSVQGPPSRDDSRPRGTNRDSRRDSYSQRESRRPSRSPDRRSSYSRDERDRHRTSPRRERSTSPRPAARSRRSSPVQDASSRRSSRTPRTSSHTRTPDRDRRRPTEDGIVAVPVRRGFSPSPGPQNQRPPTPPPPELDYWIFVGNLPRTVAERFVYDRLTAAGIAVDDVFLSMSHTRPARFAYVAVRNAVDVARACSVFSREKVAGRTLLATPFVDKTTGSRKPQISNSEYKRQYVGPERQAQRPPNERRLGLFLLHVAPSARESDVVEFLRRSLRLDQIGGVRIKPLGLNTLAYVTMTDEDLCRKAIRELDGECFCGHGVRVSWLELDKREGISRRVHVTSPAQTRDVAGPAANYAPLATNRYAQLAATAAIEQKDKAGPPPLSSPTSPTAPIAPHAASIDKPDKSQRSPLVDSREAEPPMRKSPGPPLPSAPGSARPDSEAERLDRDVARLRSVGLTIEQVEMVQQLWRPIRRADVSSGDGESADRSMELKVDFGFVSQEDAKAALAEAAFPDDPARQKRYKAFLEAQAGESRDYYTVFFAQLAEFNATSRAFADKARNGQNGGIDMDVDDTAFFKREDPF